MPPVTQTRVWARSDANSQREQPKLSDARVNVYRAAHQYDTSALNERQDGLLFFQRKTAFF